MSEDEYNLKVSKDKLGPLVPILTDAYGHVIDGFHRQKIDPNWPRVKLEHVTDPVQLSMVRLVSNVCRRIVSTEEKTKLLANIAELTGWDANEISSALGMSYRWVAKYLPDQYKRRYNKSAHRAQLPLTTSDMESQDLTPTVPVKKTDTGLVFECPCCNFRAMIIHIDPSGKHTFQEVRT